MQYFSTKDPRGFIVSCSVECWNTHLYFHPEIDGHESEAKKAIEDPRHGYIYISSPQPNHDPHCQIFYRMIPGRPAEIKVVVIFDDTNLGTVLSVCVVSHRPKGELPIWPE